MQEENGTMKQQRHHFLITCFPLQGHINPTIQLAKNLARAGLQVTFATTICGLDRVKGSLPSLDGLTYMPFSDGHDTGDGTYGGDFIGYMADLRRLGSENLTKIIHKLSDEGNPVTCLVYSLLLPWAAAVARGLHLPSAFLAIQCATAFAIYHRFLNSHDGQDSCIPVKIQDLALFNSNDLPTFLLSDNPMKPYMYPVMLEHIQELEKDPKSLVLLNTFEALEPEAIRALNNKFNAIAIGPLLPSALSNLTDSMDNSFGLDMFSKSNDDYFQWLDSKPKQSVVYVSFGSLAMMNKVQKIEILKGLLESKMAFFWVIRSSDPDVEEMTKMVENSNKIVGDGFGNGIIVSWCSQMLVLSHKSIGCFVTHCGWNSTLESLTCGVPLIGCPQFSDQPTNAKLVEEVWGTGVRARAKEYCGEAGALAVIKGEELNKLLNVVMGDGEKAKEIRENVGKWRRLARDALTLRLAESGSTYLNLIELLFGIS